jgi:hypothetical protein
MEELLWMLTIELASMQVLRSQEPMLKSCQANGNSKLDPASVLNQLTTSGLQDILVAESLKISISQSVLPLNSSKTGMELVATPTIQQKI